MNTKKRLLTILTIVAGATIGNFGYTAWTDNLLPIESMASVNSCSDLVHMYLNQDNDNDGQVDYFLYLNSNFILQGTANNYTAGQILMDTGTTKIKYYAPLSNMLYKVTENNTPGAIDNSTFYRASRVFPYNTPVRGIATTPNKVVFEKPADNDPGKKTFSIIYAYKYKYALGFDGTSTSSYRYNQVPDMGYMGNTNLTYITTLPGSEGNRKRSRSAVQSTNTCRNYQIHRCGNGVVDTYNSTYINTFTAEQCDGTAGVPAGSTCNSQCQIVTQQADLSVTKTVNNATPTIGSNVTFTMILSNAGPSTANGVTLKDLLPSGYTYVSHQTSQGTYASGSGIRTVGTIAINTTKTLTITAQVKATGSYVNTIEVTASDKPDPDSTPNNHNPAEDDQASATVTPGQAPTCTLSLSSGSLIPGASTQVTWTINGNYTNTPQITYTPTTRSITGLPYTVTTSNGQRTITPTHTGSYILSMTVSNSAGSSTCTTPLTVNPPPQNLSCTLTLNPNPSQPNQIVSVTWNVTGGTFFGTYIYVTPSLGGAWPHRVNANQYSGTTSAMPTAPGTYIFNMIVSNNQSTATCTGVLTVAANPPPTCSLTTTTPSITAGQSATLNGSYTNATSATMTPSIVGLNFTYPTRNNSNIVVSPTTTTTYILTVNGLPGTTPAICQKTITVTNLPTPTCSLTTTTPTIASGQSAILNGSYTNASLAYINPNIPGLNFIYPNRSNSNIVVHPTTTTTYTLQTLGIGGTTGATCTTTINVTNVGLNLFKSVINDILYHSGDLVGFRIDFSNNGTTTANNIILTDYLPRSLTYVSSQIFGVSPYASRTGMQGVNPFVEYSGFNLAPGQQGYLILTGRVRGYQYSGQKQNDVFLQSSNAPQLYANASFRMEQPDANATITKTSDKVSYALGENVKFTIAVTNYGPSAIDNVQIIDTWPNSSCITIDPLRLSSVPMTITTPNNPYTWNLNSSLSAGQTAYLFLTGHLSTNPSCIGNYTNNVDLRYTVDGVLKTGHAQTTIYITETSPICAIMTGSAPLIEGNHFSINYTCLGTNTTPTTPISITCGDGSSFSGFGASLNGRCSYLSSFVGNAYCTVGNNTNPNCTVRVGLEGGSCRSLSAIGGWIAIVDDDDHAEKKFRCETTAGTTAQTITIYCGNGTQHTGYNASSYEAVCQYNNVTPVPKQYNVRCEVNGTSAPAACQNTLIADKGGLGYCGNGIREGIEKCDLGENNGQPGYNCTAGCDIPGAALIGCFNVGNTNISLQKGEFLPFRWNLEYTSNIIPGRVCTDNARNGTVPRETIKCTFKIYNGDHTEANNIPVMTISRIRCDSQQWIGDGFKYFLDKQSERPSLQHAFGKYYVLANDFVHDTFGEYKIVLDRVEYDYCLDGNQQGTIVDRVCSVNFAVTQPYLAQKSSFGLTPRATTISLDGYKMLNGTDLISSTDLANIMVLNAGTYDGGTIISTMMNKFITKYSKLAVQYKTIQSEENYTIKVLKVPGQNIVVFKGTGTLLYTEGLNNTDPFTVILDGPSVKINGSIENTNAMFLLNRGNITFMTGADACSRTQIVKGIFVTNQGEFKAGPNLTNAINKPRCNFGGLKVQGILMGDGIENLVKSRRSQLNGWFYVGGSSEASIKAERRNEIFNGASVLIEYSPSLWSALPPGASEFTKALDVYKQ